jgi:hypothetical protein
MPSVRKMRLSHSFHFLKVLRELQELYERRGRSLRSARSRWERAKTNILRGHTWALENADNDDLALEVSDAYLHIGTEIFSIAVGASSRVQWFEAAVARASRVRDIANRGFIFRVSVTLIQSLVNTRKPRNVTSAPSASAAGFMIVKRRAKISRIWVKPLLHAAIFAAR